MNTTTLARLAPMFVMVALVGGSVGCSSTARPEAPAAALVESRGGPALGAATLVAPATTSGLERACGNYGFGGGGKLAAVLLIGAVVLSPVIITYLIVSFPVRAVAGRVRAWP